MPGLVRDLDSGHWPALSHTTTVPSRRRPRPARLVAWILSRLIWENWDRLDRAVSNLVDNALLHGTGDVKLPARMEAGYARVDVTDHGAVDTRLGADVFQAFAAHPGARSGANRGLGLAIAPAIVEEHRGLLTLVQRSPGQGTIRLPLSETLTT